MGSCGGSFYALEVASGEVAWKYDTAVEGLRSTFHADPVVAGDLVLAAADGSPDSHLYAFEAPTGRLRWKFPVPPRGISTGLVASADTVFGVTLGGQVIALRLADGTLRWSFELPAGLRDRRGQVHLRGDQLVVAEPDGSVFALAASTGREMWRQNLGEPVHPAVAAFGAGLLVPTAGGEGLQLSPQTGSVERRGPLGDGRQRNAVPLRAGDSARTGQCWLVADRGDDERARGRFRVQPKLHRRGISSTATNQKIRLSGTPARR